jgi:hypothetical protein
MKALKVVPSMPVGEVKEDRLHLRALVLLWQMLNPILVIVVHNRL